jgi:hypothetical protein
MLKKKRKIELLEAALKANKIVVHSLERQIALMKDPAYIGYNCFLKKDLADVDYEWLDEINMWKNFRDEMTDEELDFVYGSLPHTPMPNKTNKEK